jgi:hypothetical protein
MILKLGKAARRAGALAAGLAAAVLSTGAMAQADQCDRRCLLEHLTVYTDGLIMNDASRIDAAKNVRVTANGEVVKLGKSEVWGRISRMPYRQAFVDPETGSAMMLTTVTNTPTRDAEKWWFFMLRLKVEDRKITEIEEIAFDGTLRGTPAASMHLSDRIFDTVLPEDERVSREELIAVANQYFDVVSGTLDWRKVPWHPECQRYELATMTVNSAMLPESCGVEFENPRIKWPVKNRRIYIADVERGVVMGVGHFTAPPDYPDNNESVVFEVFKVQDGLIRHIEAMFRGNNTQKKSGWPDIEGTAAPILE